MAPLFIPHTFLNFVGPATFLFTTHYCILSMGSEALHERGYLNPPSSLLHDTNLSATTTQYAPVHADVSTDLSLPKHSLIHTPLVGEDDETCESDDGGGDNTNSNNNTDYFHTSSESLVRPVAVAYAMCAIMIILHGSTGFILFRSVDLLR